MTKPTLKLYEISNEYQKLLDFLDVEREDFLTHSDIFAEMLDEMKESFDNKSINVAAYFKSIDSEVESIKIAESEMRKRRNSLEAKSKYLKDYLLYHFELCKVDKVSCPWFTIKVQKNPPSVDILDAKLIPKEFLKIEVVETPIKSKIKFFIEDGGDCPGAELSQSNRLVIK